MTRLRLRDLPPEHRKAIQAQKRQAAAEEREAFIRYCVAAGLPAPRPEHLFHPTRKWRFDWAWPDQLLSLEVEGGAFAGGRHTRGAGFREDIEKYSEAAALGWRIVRTLPEELYAPKTLDRLRRAILPNTLTGADFAG